MKLPIALFLFSLAMFSFMTGLVVGAYEIFPYSQLKYVLNSVEVVIADRDRLISDKPDGFLAERRYEGSSVVTYDEDAASPGYTLLSGFFEDLPEIRLIRLDGSVIRRWPISYLSLYPNLDHIFPENERPTSDWNAAIHGMNISPDGSLIFSMDGKGTTKLDKCGSPLWTLPRMTHHSIDRAEDGSYWIPSRHIIEDVDAAYSLYRTPYRDDTILSISPQGKVISEISVNQILIDNGLFSLVVANGRFKTEMRESDVLHVNDIEELDEDMADQFPLFEAGDLLLSIRHLNALLVVSPVDWKVKWYQIGPWLRQHDPDFQPNGTITVFNNNSDDTNRGDILGGSTIMEITPHSPDRTVKTVYGIGDGQEFFTNTQGKHQFLENGNLLIAEYYGGRAYEVDSSGEIVWQFINVFDDDHVAKISGAKRYSQDYFEISDWACSTD